MIYKAFDEKIADAEKRLQEIKTIQKSYQTEMNQILEKISEVREKIMQSMRQYDPADEFDISAEQYAEIISDVDRFFENMARRNPKDVGYSEFSDGEETAEEAEYLDLLNDPSFAVVYEKHGWAHVKDFFDEFCELEDGEEYALVSSSGNDALREEAAERARKNDSVVGRIKNTAISTATQALR